MPNIDDIILKKKKENEFFNTYRPIKEVGEKIFKSFTKLFVPEKGYPVSQNDRRFGTLSNLMALSTLLDLDNMGNDISKFQDNFNFLLKDVFNAIYKNGYESNPVFDATPYLDENSEMLDSYVETAAKVLIVMVDLRNYANKYDVGKAQFWKPINIAGKDISSFSELAVIADKLLIDAVRFLNNSALEVKERDIRIRQIENKEIKRDQFPSEIRYRGWTFCAPKGRSDDYSTSIYYTYHATNAFIALYNAYSDIFDNAFYDIASETCNESLLNEEQKIIYEKNKKFITDNRLIINEFRTKVAAAGRYIENLLSDRGVDIALDFVKSDFTGISFSDVINMQDKNAVINTLFILAIFLNAGIDEDYEYISRIENVSKDKNWFYNQLQFAISNIKKIYNVLKIANKQELIDSFNLYADLLSEKYPAHQNVLVQQLRKGIRNVSVYDLIPLLCNTYSIVFEYIVKYPQLDMVDNLELIMENCASTNEWIWGDVDGFNINNNLYYIFALENFYDYYTNYEEPLTGNKREYNRIVKEKEAEFEEKLKEEKKKNAELEAHNKQLEVKLAEKRSNLDKEVEFLARNLFDSLFEQRMTDSLEKMLTDATMFYIDSLTGSKSPAQAKEEFKSNKKLRVALALYSSIDFNTVAFGNSIDFTMIDKDKFAKEYFIKMNNQLDYAISKNFESDSRKGE